MPTRKSATKTSPSYEVARKDMRSELREWHLNLLPHLFAGWCERYVLSTKRIRLKPLSPPFPKLTLKFKEGRPIEAAAKQKRWGEDGDRVVQLTDLNLNLSVLLGGTEGYEPVTKGLR